MIHRSSTMIQYNYTRPNYEFQTQQQNIQIQKF